MRDKEKREVDFLIAEKNRPVELIEVKLSDNGFSDSLLYYSEKLPGIKSVQVVKDIGISRSKKNIRMLSGIDFLKDRVV